MKKPWLREVIIALLKAYHSRAGIRVFAIVSITSIMHTGEVQFCPWSLDSGTMYDFMFLGSPRLSGPRGCICVYEVHDE